MMISGMVGVAGEGDDGVVTEAIMASAPSVAVLLLRTEYLLLDGVEDIGTEEEEVGILSGAGLLAETPVRRASAVLEYP